MGHVTYREATSSLTLVITRSFFTLALTEWHPDRWRWPYQFNFLVTVPLISCATSFIAHNLPSIFTPGDVRCVVAM